MSTDLIKLKITPKEVFVPGGLDPVLKAVDNEIEKFKKENNLDMNKKTDRDILRSFSADIPRSKTFVDNKRKEYVKDKKAELKIIDSECKSFRDAMDKKRDETRKPLTDWEDAEKKRIEEERQLEIYLIEWDEAIEMNSLFDREKEIARKEAEFKKLEEEKERLEREEQLKKEAEEKAKKEAEEKIQAEKDKVERLKQEAIEAEKEKERAIQKAKDDAEAKAKAEKEAEEQKKKEQEEIEARKAANLNHQRRINREIIEDVSKIGITEEGAKLLITEILKKNVRNLTINY